MSEVAPNVLDGTLDISTPYLSKNHNMLVNLKFTLTVRGNWVKVNGSIFKPGAAVIHNTGSEDRDMEIAIITNVYIINSSTIIFKTKSQLITDYKKHYRAHVLTPLELDFVFKYDMLPIHIPIHPRICRVLPNDNIVIMPFYII